MRTVSGVNDNSWVDFLSDCWLWKSHNDIHNTGFCHVISVVIFVPLVGPAECRCRTCAVGHRPCVTAVCSRLQSFVSCEIGCVGDRAGGGDGDVAASPRSSRLHMPALPFRWSLSSPLRRSASQSCAVATVPAGSQDDQYGTAVAFTGQIGSLYVLQEALLAAQVRALHHLGTYVRREDFGNAER